MRRGRGSERVREKRRTGQYSVESSRSKVPRSKQARSEAASVQDGDNLRFERIARTISASSRSRGAKQLHYR